MIASSVFNVIILLQFVVAASDDVFIESPQSVNVIHGMSVVFNCTISMADVITYRVNKTLLTQNIPDGFEEGPVIAIDGSYSRSLTATALVQYNNTNITCIRVIFGQPTEYSEQALLLVQGPSSSVVDLSYSFIDSSTVNILWSPPFTLPGTDITGYNISATSNGTTTNYFTSNSYYVLSLTDITDSPCNEIIITVSGYNGLDGQNISLTGIYLPSSVTNEGALDVLPLFLREVEDSVQLSSISINVSSICYGQYPTHINLTIQYSNNGSLLTTIDNIPLVSTNDTDILTTTNDTIILLPVDNNYTVIISFSNLGGLFYFHSTIVFDTNIIHGVQNVVLVNITAPTIVLVCVFSYNTTTVPVVPVVGCVIELVLIEDESIRFTGTGNRTGNDEAVVTIVTVLPGSYSVRVYDINSNNDQSSVTAYKINELIILPQPSSTSVPVILTTSGIQTESMIMITSGRSHSMSREQYTISTSIDIMVSVSPSISFSNICNCADSSTSTISVTVIVTVVCIVVIFEVIIIIGILILVLLYKRSTKKRNAAEDTINNVVPVVPNPSYQDPRDIIRQRNRNQDMNPLS